LNEIKPFELAEAPPAPPQKEIVRAQQELQQVLQPEISRGDVTLQQTEDRLIIMLAAPMLFASGDDHLKPEGLHALRQVGNVLKTLPNKHVRVEGHTDNVPISKELMKHFPTNMDLSTARATNAARSLEESGVAAGMIRVKGHADMHPVATNTTEAGRQKNRRIEIIVSEGNDLEGSRVSSMTGR
jgi:chemotaxis protein MotB